MAKMDKLKEQLKILRFWLGSAMAIMVAVLGWLITNYPKISNLLILGAVLVIVALLLVIIVLSVIMHKKCESIGKIKK